MITINNINDLEQYNDNYIFGGKQYTIPDSCIVNCDLLDRNIGLFVRGNLHSEKNIFVGQIAANNIMSKKKLIAIDIINADGYIFGNANAKIIRSKNKRKIS